jgi:Acyl-CoA synthetases (AMP-forming)/AMP-acid ligases II
LKPGYVPSRELAASIFDFASKNLARYKIPRIIEFVDELPKTISGKIRRIKLREREKIKKERGQNEYFYEDFFK